MKKVLLAAVALICMSVCVASCSKDEEDNKRNAVTLDIEKLAQWTETEIDVNDFYMKCRDIRNSYQEEDCDGWKITRDGRGQVTKVLFEDNSRQQPPKNGEEFFAMFFDEDVSHSFQRVEPNYSANSESWIESLGERRISHFSFAYDANGVMTQAQGEYIPLDGFSITPRITAEEAIYISCHGDIPDKSVRKMSAILAVEVFPKDSIFVPRLVYTVHFRPATGAYGCYPGVLVDAQTGKVIATYTINI